MNNFPTELIYVLAFAAFALVQYFLKKFEGQEQHDDTPPDETFARSNDDIKEAAVASVLKPASVDHFGRGEASRVPTLPVRTQFDRASILGTKRDVQKAMVIAMIVGPCRASEPHDVRQ